jgi:TPR repeat protein
MKTSEASHLSPMNKSANIHLQRPQGPRPGFSQWGFAIVALAIASLSSLSNAGPIEEGVTLASAGNYDGAFKAWGQLSGPAIFALALQYHEGQGVEQNEVMAVRLYQLSAEYGYRPAQEYLVAGYENGWFGLPKRPEIAAYWRVKVGTPAD